MNNKACAPQTKEEYDAKQSIIRRVTDPETGLIRYILRHQLWIYFYFFFAKFFNRVIKGDGEILEEIVSRDRQKEINRHATKGDGKFFQSQTVGWNMD